MFGRGLQSDVDDYASAPGAIGLAAQVAFAFMPLVQSIKSTRKTTVSGATSRRK